MDAIRTLLEPMKDDCMVLLNNEHDAGMNIEQVLDTYETFHHMTRDNSWGKVPWPCSCPGSHRDCVCKHGSLLTSIFDAEVHVPKDYIAAEPSLRKKTQKLRGAEEGNCEEGVKASVHGYGRERRRFLRSC